VCDPSDGERVTCAEPLCGLAGFALVQPGRYTRGSDTDPWSPVSNAPAHEVEVTRPFYVHTFEVTWNALGEDISPPELGERPARGLNWFQAVSLLNQRSHSDALPACYTLSGCTGSAFCHALRGMDCEPLVCQEVSFAGLDCRGWRLPTEAEWEYATRAGTTTELYNGDLLTLDNGTCTASANLDLAGWYCANAADAPQPVAQKLPNPWGLYDTLGNVWEWTQDGYAHPSMADYRPRQGFLQDPFREDGRLRIVRGGSFPDTSLICTSATRQLLDPEVRYTNVGFRGVRRFAPVLESRR
jgi:formylglycine-generating enzyme required for sulfatase activity